jgi:hypothetical protein
LGYRAGRHLSFACEAGAKYAEPTASSTGHLHLPPSAAGISTSDGRLAFFKKLIQSHHDTRNGFTEDFDAAPAVHVMHTEGDAAEVERLGGPADSQHLKEGEGGRAQHYREAAEGCAKIWSRRYDAAAARV